MDVFSQKLSDFASGLSFFQKSKDKNKANAPNVRITSDPYVTVVLGEARVARTRVVSNTVNPAWNEHFSIPVAHYVHDIVFNVKDQDMLGTQHIGDVKIPVSQARPMSHALNQSAFDTFGVVSESCPMFWIRAVLSSFGW